MGSCTTAETPSSPISGSISGMEDGATSPSGIWAELSSRPVELAGFSPGGPCPTPKSKTISTVYADVIGDGPVYGVGTKDGVIGYPDRGSWFSLKVLWVIRDYDGPVLIRGRQVDGPNQLRFGLDAELPELRFEAGETGATVDGMLASERFWPSYVAWSSPGCYVWQADGIGFTQTIVVETIAFPK